MTWCFPLIAAVNVTVFVMLFHYLLQKQVKGVDMSNKTIRTISGRKIDPFNIQQDDICIEDIAHSLSMQCRYNGHSRHFYSVAEHSILVSQCLPASCQLWGLLHDATEAYIGDMISPIKHRLTAFIELEANIHLVIATRFNLPVEIPPLVHQADHQVFERELEWLDSRCMDPRFGMTGLMPELAALKFLEAFHRLERIRLDRKKRDLNGTQFTPLEKGRKYG